MALNIPAEIGTRIEDVDTPCLLIDLDAYERNLKRMADFVSDHGLRHRAHAKTHKSADISHDQFAHGAVGVCCQKVSEAEALLHGGVRDLLVSNEVVSPHMINRLAAMATQARVLVCTDDAGNVDDLEAGAARFGVTLEVLVEIDVGAGRCGVAPGADAVPIAKKIAAADHLVFAGLQSYQGKAQHVHDYTERKAKIDEAVAMTRDTVGHLAAEGLSCDIVGGAGTGTYEFEGTSEVYNELQCGSYIFMDADYQRIHMADGRLIDDFENSLFLYTTVMSKTKTEKAICDAGLKAQSVDSGPAVVFSRDDIEYLGASDEHGVISDPSNHLSLGDKLKLVPGHCDPTVNIHDWYVGVRNGVVERLLPVTARGMCL
ncbi:DSD1 family PLP-dependent enzyme [Salinisphaera sp. USBA-960]|uniref:DSD1 family PLP-dependent enzyme n=1 Tax=Salinisphaera orenii TaxID=856731 RepID=UPI000DBE5A30|nr:DSD1 family PLP-dependent enzyme [Salifodinibacter halophilus]NNC26510.1 DSD1 family PLP-dependent enzyme [Salifodinibacter halophilus]